MPKRSTTIVGARLLAASIAALAVSGTAVSMATADSADPLARAGIGTAISDDNTAASGGAYGTSVTGNAVAGSGRTSFSVMCTRRYDTHNSNQVAGNGTDLDGSLDVRGVRTDVEAFKTDGQRNSQAVTKIAYANLGDGAVEIEGLKSVARVTETTDGFERFNEVTVARLAVVGEDIPVSGPLDRQTIEVPGVIKVTFAAHSGKTTETAAQTVTLAVKARLADGTLIKVGRSRAILGTHTGGVFHGGAWGTDLSALNLVSSGRTGFQPLPCGGTKGETKTNDTAAITVPGLGTIGATESTARTFFGSDPTNPILTSLDEKTVTALTHASVAGLHLGDGALDIDLIEAGAQVTRKADKSLTRTPTVNIVGFKVNGQEQAPTFNQPIEIPGLGTIEFGKVTETKRGLVVTAVCLTLLDDPEDPNDAPVVLNLGVAKTSAG